MHGHGQESDVTNEQHRHAAVAEVHGARLSYDIVGDGPPVVLIHAGIADRRMWDDLSSTRAVYAIAPPWRCPYATPYRPSPSTVAW